MYWTVFLVRECNLETEQGKTALYPSGDVKFYFEAVNGFALSLVLVTNRPQKFDLCAYQIVLQQEVLFTVWAP